ncbi:hypothetical protein TNCV_3080801 [Trichonephila clavipes]|nr:hypothetical protein TNCV_3080801 [Trichonephila clavipes]
MSILRLVAAFASQSARSFPRTPVCPRTNAKSIEMFLSLRLLSCFWISTIILLDEEIHLRESKEERESVQMRYRVGPTNLEQPSASGQHKVSNQLNVGPCGGMYCSWRWSNVLLKLPSICVVAHPVFV